MEVTKHFFIVHSKLVSRLSEFVIQHMMLSRDDVICISFRGATVDSQFSSNFINGGCIDTTFDTLNTNTYKFIVYSAHSPCVRIVVR